MSRSNGRAQPGGHGDHPDMRDNAPGRIPESLIDAAMDGELDPQIQREIGNALQYDPERRQQFHDTRDAINALRLPVDMPDLSDRVLARANRHRRFIPAKLRTQIRAGRVGMAALLLITLLGVAGLQRMYPRLTTISSQQTPVHDIQAAVQQDSAQIAQVVSNEFETLCSTVAPVVGMFDRPIERPGQNNHRFSAAISPATYTATSDDRYNYLSRSPMTHSGLVMISMMQANELARSDAPQNTRFGLFPAEGSGYLVYASWSSQSIHAAPDRDDHSDRSYQVPELP